MPYRPDEDNFNTVREPGRGGMDELDLSKAREKKDEGRKKA